MQAISVRKTKPQRGKNHSEGAIYFQASVFLQYTKGQYISKQNCRAVTSPKKITDEFVFLS